jgi:5-hydroxyisourate hydrolase-like protein (transthyretin family)
VRDSDTLDSDSGEPADGVRKGRSDHDSDDHPEESSVVEEDANNDDGRLGWSWDKKTMKEGFPSGLRS